MKIICQNTNGITNKISQIGNAEVLVLIETHTVTEAKRKKLNKWLNDYTLEHTNGRRNTRGVIIAIKKHIAYKLIAKSNDGNYLIIETSHEGLPYTITELYLDPDIDNMDHLEKIKNEVSDILTENNNTNNIIIGDLNCFGNKIDSKIETQHTKKCIFKYERIIKPLLEKLDLVDGWRNKNETKIEYTHISNTNCNRLDHCLINRNIITTSDTTYKTIGDFDHKGIIFKLHKMPKWGKGTWKINISILKDKNTEQDIKQTIDKAKKKKAQFQPLEWWDYLKNQIKKKHVFTTTSDFKKKKTRK